MSNNEYEESSKQKKEREIESRYGSKPVEAKKAFDVALESMIQKFEDCPVCQGAKEYCPTPQMGYARCPTRRASIKHLKAGRGGIRRV